MSATAIFGVLILVRLSTVTNEWVHRAARSYAERLFDALDEKVDLDEHPPKKLELA
jgi:hypothetical protein